MSDLQANFSQSPTIFNHVHFVFIFLIYKQVILLYEKLPIWIKIMSFISNYLAV